MPSKQPQETCLQAHRPLADGLSRLIKRQVQHDLAAFKAARDPEHAVHELRQGLKRNLALLQLGAASTRHAQRLPLYRYLRDAHRAVARLRDASVQHDLLRMHAQQPHAARQAIKRRYRRALENFKESAKKRATTALRHAATQELTFPPFGRTALLKRMLQTYRPLRKMAHSPLQHSELSRLHRCRTLYKTHAIHLELLTPIAPNYIGARLHATRSVGRLLGDHRDLTLLLRQLPGTREHSPETLRLEVLLQDAVDLARWACASRPGALRNELHERLRCWQRQQRQAAKP